MAHGKFSVMATQRVDEIRGECAACACRCGSEVKGQGSEPQIISVTKCFDYYIAGQLAPQWLSGPLPV